MRHVIVKIRKSCVFIVITIIFFFLFCTSIDNIKVRTRRVATKVTITTKILMDESDKMSSKISDEIKRSRKKFIVL